MADIKVSKDFLNDFNFVMKHYCVTGSELEFEKSRVRENYESARVFYRDVALLLKEFNVEGWKKQIKHIGTGDKK